jgi:hypothetical protein
MCTMCTVTGDLFQWKKLDGKTKRHACTLCSTGTSTSVYRILYSTIGILACMHLVFFYITILKNRLTPDYISQLSSN